MEQKSIATTALYESELLLSREMSRAVPSVITRQIALDRVPQVRPLAKRDKSARADTEIIRVGDSLLGSQRISWIVTPKNISSLGALVALGHKLEGSNVACLRASGGDGADAERERKLVNLTARCFGLPVVVPVQCRNDLANVESLSDVIELGIGGMPSVEFLKELSFIPATILFQRAANVAVLDYLKALELLELGGKARIIIGENGVRTADDSAMNALDISSFIEIKQQSSWPVVMNGAAIARGPKELERLAFAATSVGGNGFMVEIDCSGESGSGEISVDEFESIRKNVHALRYTLNAVRQGEGVR